ncbi:MAG: hypothetical protein PHQ96_03035 [Candidatus Omnitrophica bacterium]|nr:hypothetical protein [Candidatus Omnitrophota bacterium]
MKDTEDKYSVDENNRLVIARRKASTQARGKKKISPAGKFFIDNKNKLSWLVNELKAVREQYNLPEKINLEGTWSLNSSHDLVFTLNKTKNRTPQEKLYLKAELLDVSSSALIFSLATTEESGRQVIRLMQLKGRWQADKYNRLNFLVQKSGSIYDTLTFQGSWEVRNNTLIYTYKKTYLKKKERLERTLAFKGFWQMNERNRLTYVLDLNQDSYFSFRVALETPSILAKTGEIRYRLGIGIEQNRLPKTRVITLYGLWKVSKDFGLSFEIDYGEGLVREMRFGAQLRLAKNNEIKFQLTGKEGKDAGLGVTFSRSFLKNNAQWFLAIRKQGQNQAIEGGLKAEW